LGKTILPLLFADFGIFPKKKNPHLPKGSTTFVQYMRLGMVGLAKIILFFKCQFFYKNEGPFLLIFF
jgi:hypothetical protein